MAGVCVKREDGVTICAECRHENLPFCAAPGNRREETVDVVSGDVNWRDQDGVSYAGPMPLCETVNEGACPHYEAI